MVFRKVVYETSQPVLSGIQQPFQRLASYPLAADRSVTPEGLQVLIEELFHKEAEITQLALHYVKKAKGFRACLFRSSQQDEPGIRREARRLLQSTMITALRRTENGEAEQRTVDYLLKYLYMTSLTEVERSLPNYFAQERTPESIFVNRVWEASGTRAEGRVFTSFADHLFSLVNTLLDLFALTIQGFTKDPHGIFTAFVEAMGWKQP